MRMTWHNRASNGGGDLADEPGLRNNDVAGADSAHLNSGSSGQPGPWGRAERKNLFIWVGVGFLLPGVFLYLLRAPLKPNGSFFTIQRDLPVKAILAFFVVLATWIVSRLQKRPLDDYGIPPRQAVGKRFWEGLLWGFAALSAIVLILRALGHFQFDSVALTGAAAYRYGLGWGAVFLGVAIHEEFAFRGYWLFSFSRRFRFWPAALFVSVVFGAAHLGNPGENVLGIVQVVATGLFFCLIIRRTGNLWFAVGFHAAWDWAETFFYGTPDSGLLGVGRLLNTSVQGPNWITGGSAGPEGSVFAFFVLLIFALLVHLRFPTAIYPDRPA
jgi:membrane protease YdiL (CAAX protease family)